MLAADQGTDSSTRPEYFAPIAIALCVGILHIATNRRYGFLALSDCSRWSYTRPRNSPQTTRLRWQLFLIAAISIGGLFKILAEPKSWVFDNSAAANVTC